jgi:hypothetical protein
VKRVLRVLEYAGTDEWVDCQLAHVAIGPNGPSFRKADAQPLNWPDGCTIRETARAYFPGEWSDEEYRQMEWAVYRQMEWAVYAEPLSNVQRCLCGQIEVVGGLPMPMTCSVHGGTTE